MKIFTTIFLLFVGFSVIDAQPVIERSDLFVPGKVLFVQSANNPSGNGASGADVNWDFSSILPEDEPVEVNIGNADTTLFFPDFPGSNVALSASEGGFDYYSYFHVDNQGIDYLGDVVPGFTLTTYSDPESVLRFPLTYNTAWEDDFSYTLEFFVSPISTEAEGSLSAVVDGYGTLVLPHTTFSDVLRLRTVTITSDTTNLGLGISERVITVDTSYTWLSPSYHGPLCSASYTHLTRTVYLMDVDTTIVDSETEEFVSFSYDPLSGESSSIPGDIVPGKFDLRISPNPFVQTFDIAFHSDRAQPMRLTLRDIYGQIVHVHDMHGNAGSNTLRVQLPDLPAGMYLAFLEAQDGADIQKLMRVGEGQ